jgi:CIC family chloride channel protein
MIAPTLQSPFRRLVSNQAWRWFLLSGAVGLVGGLAAIAFYYLSAQLSVWVLGGIAGYEPGGPINEPPVLSPVHVVGAIGTGALVLLVVLPAIGNFLAGFLALKYAPDAIGHGTDAAIDAYHRKRGEITIRTTIVKVIASALTLGSGGSGGREGPIAQIGAGFGVWLAKRLRLSTAERRVLLAVGLAAGIGAIFRAPLAAALFSAEILYRRSDFESEVLIPSTMASILAYCVFSVVTGDFKPLFQLGDPTAFTFSNPLELLPYTGLALALVVGGILYVRIFYGMEWIAAKLVFIPRYIKPLLGGALTGGIAVGLFIWVGDIYAGTAGADAAQFSVLSVLSFGYGLIQALIDPTTAAHHGTAYLTLSDATVPALTIIGVLLLIAVGKMLATGFTIGWGGSAGVFGPSMVIGGCIGGAVGVLFAHTGLVDHPEPFVILGMAGFFAGVAKTPISTVIMVSELTGSYGLLVPAMWVCTLAYLILMGRAALYRKQPETRSDSMAHRGDFLLDVFRGLTVKDVMPRRLERAHTVQENRSFIDLVPEVLRSSETYFPVVDARGRLTGIFSVNDIREVLHDETLAGLLTAKDIATVRVVTLTTGDSLNDALLKFTERAYEYLPVVEDGDDGRLIGVLSRRALLSEYTDRLHSIKRSAGETGRFQRIEL